MQAGKASLVVFGMRELLVSAKHAKENSKTPRTVPNVKMFNDRRATFFMQLGQVAVDAWKRKAGFPTDPDEVVATAVIWLDRDRYMMCHEGFDVLVTPLIVVFLLLGCKDEFWVPSTGVGDKGHLRGLLGRASFASVKVIARCASLR